MRQLLNVALARDEVAGFYLPETEVLYVVEEVPAPFSMRFASLLLRRDLVREAVCDRVDDLKPIGELLGT